MKTFIYILFSGIARGGEGQYTAKQSKCDSPIWYDRLRPSMTHFVKGPSSDEEMMKQVVTLGPVVTRMDIDHPSFMLYGSGIYEEPECSQETNHAVVVVGYGTENGTDYWLILNSMGTNWGENGLMKIARNKNNHCGIGMQYWFPKFK